MTRSTHHSYPAASIRAQWQHHIDAGLLKVR